VTDLAAIIIVGHIMPHPTPGMHVARVAPGARIPAPPAATGHYDALAVSDYDARGRQPWIDAAVDEHIGPFVYVGRYGVDGGPPAITIYRRIGPAKCPECGHGEVTLMSALDLDAGDNGRLMWVAGCERCEHAVIASTIREAGRMWNAAAGKETKTP